METQRYAVTAVLLVLTLLSSCLFIATIALAESHKYTLDADFDEGVRVNVNHDAPNNDQLQLSEEQETLPFIWVPNNEGTVSKIDTETGDELGRYRVSPISPSHPSRTTVDLEGDCWVGVRTGGTVVKIGLYEAGHWQDRNFDGICQTSRDTNGNGDIDAGEILPWGQDECVLYEVFLKAGVEATRVPGDTPYPHSDYDASYWGTSPRALAVDASNNLWVARYQTAKYFYVDGSTGSIQRTVDIEGHFPNNGPYGAVIDGNGLVWTSGQGSNKVLWLDPADDSTGSIPLGYFAYGMALDSNDHLFVSGWSTNRLIRIDVVSKSILTSVPAPTELRGVACTSDGDVWTASTSGDRVYRYSNDLTTQKAAIPVGNGPTGVAVDSNGKVWACNLNENTVKRIDPSTNGVDLSKPVLVSPSPSEGAYHYSYSDMTGVVSRTITTQIGTWTVIRDSGAGGTEWGTISWNGEPQGGTPGDSSITVKARAADTVGGLASASYITVSNSVEFSLAGQYIEVVATLQASSNDESPILSDLTIADKAGAEIPGPIPAMGTWAAAGAVLALGALAALTLMRRRQATVA